MMVALVEESVWLAFFRKPLSVCVAVVKVTLYGPQNIWITG